MFCFPYAGGGAAVYDTWPSALPAGVEVACTQLPGRENRFLEPPFIRIEPLVRALMAALVSSMDRPFAFFGHSMGALIAFELARELRRQNRVSPLRLYVSAHRAPQPPKPTRALHRLPDAEFWAEMRRLDGTPHEILQDPELRQLLLPALRADFALCETHSYVSERPLDCPIVAFGGLDDRNVCRDELEAWREQSLAPLALYMMSGNHFFIHTARTMLLQTLAQNLAQLL